MNFGEVRSDQLAKFYSPHLHAGAPGIFSDVLRSVQMLKREWSAESNGKLPHLFIPSKTVTMIPEFAVDDPLLGRTVVLVPEFVMKERPAVGQNTLIMIVHLAS